MSRTTKPLTISEIERAKPKSRAYSLYDGMGLELVISPQGSKLWRYRYYRPGKSTRTVISFGKYEYTTLEEAREKRDEARKLVAQKIDPQDHKKEQREKKRLLREETFAKVTAEWFKTKESAGLKPHTLQDIMYSMNTYVLPYIGSVPISFLTAPDFVAALKPTHDAGKLDIVKRSVGRINEIMYYALHTGRIQTNTAARIRKCFAKPVKEHHPALMPEELPLLTKALKTANVRKDIINLIHWQLLTLTRASEATQTRWDEIDFENKIWHIPAQRMKMRVAHNVPLCKQAIAILENMKSVSNSEYVFPDRHDNEKPIHSQAATYALRRMGFKDKLVSHGMRAIASTTLHEKGFNTDVIETALAHSDTNRVRKIYNRAQYLSQRTEMLAWWGDHVEQSFYA